MKRKTIWILLGLECAVLLLLLWLRESLPTAFSSLLAFPFEQLGALLRLLSCSGRLGNAGAWALLAGLSLLLVLPALQRSERGKGERAALIVAGLTLPAVLLGMANPTALPGGTALLPVMKAILGAALWSVLLCWAVLRLLRLFRQGSKQQLYGYLRLFLLGLCAVCLAELVLGCARELPKQLKSAQCTADGIAAVLRFLAAALPYAMDVAVALSALTLLDRLRADERAGASAAAERLSRLSGFSLAVVTAAVAGVNIVQLLLLKELSDIHATVQLPVMSLAFVLGTLLLSRLITENGRLADENDNFI